MTRRKKKQPVKVGDLKVEKEDDTATASSQLTTNGSFTESVQEATITKGTVDLKLMQNGHHLLEGGPDGDRNGNTLIRGDDADQFSSHHLKNNCKIQLSKVKVTRSISDLTEDCFSAMGEGQLEQETAVNRKPDGNQNELSSAVSQRVNGGEIEHPSEDTASKDHLQDKSVGGTETLGGSEFAMRGDKTLTDKAFPTNESGQHVHIESHSDTSDMEDEKNKTTHLDEEMEDQNGVSSADAQNIEGEKGYEFCKDFYKRRRPMEVPDDFICPLCQKVYDNPRDLTVHIRGHNEASSHTCNICSKKLSSASSLDRHMLIHSGERPFQCTMCEMSFTTNGNMNRHMRTHDKGAKEEHRNSPVSKGTKGNGGNNGSPSKRAKLDSEQLSKSDNELTCPVCHKTFICRIGYETHMTFHPDMTQNCVFCNLTFRNQKGLRMHLYKVHKNEGVGKNDAAIEPPQEDSPPNKSIDDLCVAEFSTKQFPKIAQLWCEENSLRIDGDGRARVCLQCNKAFPCLSSLNLHLNSAHLPKPKNAVKRKTKLKSRKDGKILDSLNQPKSPKDDFMHALSLQPMRKDSKLVHRPANGKRSSSELDSNSWLKNYMKQDVHTSGLWKGFPVIPFNQNSGELSGRTGRPQPQSFSPLKGEMAEGAPKKPLVKSEKGVDKFEMMKIGHGPLSREQDSELDTGDVGVGMLTPVEFASANSLIDEGEFGDQAMMEETDMAAWEGEGIPGKVYKHVCKFCSKTFPFRSTLKVHVRSHMGLTPYKCMLCEYSSADKSTLVRHMRTHSGERPYSCKLCHFPFTTKANCERHVKKRHGKLSKLDVDVNIQHHPLQRLPEQGQFSSPDTVCKICKRDFKFFRDLQNHMRIHEKSPSKIYACLKCKMNFSKKNQCVRHMLRKHRHLSSSEIQQHVQKLSIKQENAAVEKKDTKPTKQSIKETFSAFKEMPFTSQLYQSGLPRPVPVYINTGYQVYPSEVQEEPLDLSMPKKGVCPPMFSPDKPSTSLNQQAGGISQEDAKLSLGASRYKEPYIKFYSPRLDALVCPHCLRLFKKGSRLKTHIRSHTTERPFRCSMCSAAFTRSSSLDEHMIKRHYEDQDDQSEIKYGITPMQRNLMKREQLQQQVSILKSCLQPKEELLEYERPVLGGRVDEGSDTSAVSKSDPNAELSSISKMLAAATTTSFHQYMTSQISHHLLADQNESPGDQEERQDQMNELSDKEAEPEGELVIAEFPENPDLIKTEGDDALKGSRSGKLESRQTCPYCQRKFPWVSSLRRHLITHTGLKPYECPHCGATFSTKSNCERHINRRHQGHKEGEEEGSEVAQREPFRCKECKVAAFSTRRKLQKHYKEEHPVAFFPKEYMEAPDVIVNNKDLIDKIQQGYDPVLSPTVTSLVPEGTKKRNQLFFGSTSQVIKQEPLDQQSLDESSSVHSSSVHTGSFSEHQQGEDFLESMSFNGLEDHAPRTMDDDSSAMDNNQVVDNTHFVVKEEQGPDGDYTSITEKVPEYSENGENTGGLRLGESFSDRGVSDDEGANSDSDSHVSGDQTGLPTMVGGDLTSSSSMADLATATPLIIPHVTITPRKGKKGARYNCEQCCKKFKTEQTLIRHLKVHQLEHPFKCTECAATFTTKFNCQRHMIKLHGKSKEDVVNIVGSNRVVDGSKRPSHSSSPSKKMKVSPSLYSHGGSSMVKILPKHSTHSASSKKKHSSKKIKNILPKPEQPGKVLSYSGEALAMDQGLTDYSNGNLANGQLPNSHDGVSNLYNGDGSGMAWSYTYTDSPTGLYGTSRVTAPSIQEEAGSILGNSDIIKDLLGIQDASTMDQLLESADSAAKILGVQG